MKITMVKPLARTYLMKSTGKIHLSNVLRISGICVRCGMINDTLSVKLYYENNTNFDHECKIRESKIRFDSLVL